MLWKNHSARAVQLYDPDSRRVERRARVFLFLFFFGALAFMVLTGGHIQQVLRKLHNSGRVFNVHPGGGRRQMEKGRACTGCRIHPNSEPARAVQVQAPPLRARLAEEKTTHRPARQKLRLHVTPVVAAHAMPEFNSGELGQSLSVAGQNERVYTPSSVRPTRGYSLDLVGAEAGNVTAPQFRARAAARKKSRASVNRCGLTP